MQKEIVSRDELLDQDGNLKTIGYSKKMIVDYNREVIKKKGRIKEWDYYYIGDSRFGLCLTISGLSYANVISASVIDFISIKDYNKTSMQFFPKQEQRDFFPRNSLEGLTYLKTKDAEFSFDVKPDGRYLSGIYKNYYGKGVDLEFAVKLTSEPEESMVKSTPFKKENQFYYNQKINCMTASGYFTFKGRKYEFLPNKAMATLDWGRGVLPYNSMWYWASMQTRLEDGKTFGFNLGCELGDNSQATENMIFYDGKAHKLGDIKIYTRHNNRGNAFMGDWTFYSDDRRLELVFEPIIDRHPPFNIIFLKFIPHQVFGTFKGQLTLDDGQVIKLEDVIGFAEKVVNRW